MFRPIAIRLLPLPCALALCGASTIGSAAADEKKPAAAKADPAEAASAETHAKGKGKAEGEAKEDEGGGLQAAKFMPLGRPNLEVKIPQFEDGELQCVMNAMEMTRVGENDIDIKSMDLEFIEDGQTSTRIELLDAQYNLVDRLLSSDKRAVVQRSDFTLVGETLKFDTVEQKGTMEGKVRMVIHDSSGLSGKKEDEEKTKAGADGNGPVGLSVAEAARMIARVAAFQQRQAAAVPQN